MKKVLNKAIFLTMCLTVLCSSISNVNADDKVRSVKKHTISGSYKRVGSKIKYNKAVKLSWDKSDNVTGYEISVYGVASKKWRVVKRTKKTQYIDQDTATVTAEVEVLEDQTEVIVDKMMIASSEEVAGCHLKITDIDGNEIVSWITGDKDSIKLNENLTEMGYSNVYVDKVESSADNAKSNTVDAESTDICAIKIHGLLHDKEYSFSTDQVEMLNYLMSTYSSSSNTITSGGTNSSKSSLSADEIKSITDKISDPTQKKACSYALSKVGYPYSQPKRDSGNYYDCSSLAFYSWKEAGINISYEGSNCAAAEANYCDKNGKSVKEADIKPGDLVFYSYYNNGRYKNITHVGIYVGDGKMVEAVDEKTGVVIKDYHNENMVMIGRPN